MDRRILSASRNKMREDGKGGKEKESQRGERAERGR